MTLTPPDSSRRCAAHPDTVARAACVDCQRAVCAGCAPAGGEARCTDCRSRHAERTRAFDALVTAGEGWTFRLLWAAAWSALRGSGASLSAGVLLGAIAYGTILFGSSMALFALGGLLHVAGVDTRWVLSFAMTWGFHLGNAVASGVFLGLAAMSLDALAGRSPGIERLLPTWRALGSYLVLALGIAGVQVAFDAAAQPFSGAGVLALKTLVRGALVLLLVPLATVVVAEQLGPLKAVRRFVALARGNVLALAGVLMLSLAVISAGGLVLGVGVLPGLALAQLLCSALYLALRGAVSVRAGPAVAPAAQAEPF